MQSIKRILRCECVQSEKYVFHHLLHSRIRNIKGNEELMFMRTNYNAHSLDRNTDFCFFESFELTKYVCIKIS